MAHTLRPRRSARFHPQLKSAPLNLSDMLPLAGRAEPTSGRGRKRWRTADFRALLHARSGAAGWDDPLERWDLCDYLTVVEVIMVAAACVKEELHAVGADAVVAGVHGDVSARPDRASGIRARGDLQGGLDEVPRVAPHHRDRETDS